MKRPSYQPVVLPADLFASFVTDDGIAGGSWRQQREGTNTSFHPVLWRSSSGCEFLPGYGPDESGTGALIDMSSARAVLARLKETVEAPEKFVVQSLKDTRQLEVNGYGHCEPHTINAHGEVAGRGARRISSTQSMLVPLYWDAQGKCREITLAPETIEALETFQHKPSKLDVPFREANFINDDGQIPVVLWDVGFNGEKAVLLSDRGGPARFAWADLDARKRFCSVKGQNNSGAILLEGQQWWQTHSGLVRAGEVKYFDWQPMFQMAGVDDSGVIAGNVHIELDQYWSGVWLPLEPDNPLGEYEGPIPLNTLCTSPCPRFCHVSVVSRAGHLIAWSSYPGPRYLLLRQ